MNSKFKALIVVLMLGGVLQACDGGLKKLSNQELAAKNDQCVQGNPTAPGKVTACENIRKECMRRREQGNFAC